MALKGPVPPSSTTLDAAVDAGVVSCADTGFIKQAPLAISKTSSAYILFISDSFGRKFIHVDLHSRELFLELKVQALD